MNTRVEKMIQQFNNLEVPLTRRFTTGPEESSEIGRLTDEYFNRVVASLALSKRALESFFSIECRVFSVENPGNVRVTDDFDTSLWLSEVQPLASVRNVRDGSNFQVILFAKYPFTPTSERYLQSISEAEELQERDI